MLAEGDKYMFKELKEQIKTHQGQFWESLFGFLIAVAGCVLLLFNVVETKMGDTIIYLTGRQVFFGLDGFGLEGAVGFIRLFIYGLPIFGILMICTSFFYKPLRGMASLFLISSGILILCIPQLINPDNTIYEYAKLTTFAYFAIGLFFVSAICLFLSEYTYEVYTVSEISEMAILIAMAIIFQYIKIYSTPYGSINLQIIPLAMIAMRCKSSRAFLASGIIFGMITCLLDGYGLYTFPLEYLIAFGSVSILSFFRKTLLVEGRPLIRGFFLIPLALGLATTIRYFCTIADSVIFWEVTFEEAAVGAAIPVFSSGLLAIIAMEIMYSSPIFIINKLFPPSDYKQLTKTDIVIDTINNEDNFK